ncbi:Na/Pi symporter [Bacillus pinisoli]|uniref:Na/Pi symporter n=1 Tax=Bacillus pinisoli TaxID=2901866 RepID=UPI001FF401F0|nr:Na/Pi symporter [Bacillus pinisoli]
MSKEIIWFGVFIAIFMYGLTVMRIGLDQLSSDNLKKQLLLVTRTPVQGLLIGAILAALLQSSSALMVITIGFVAAGLLSFKQSIGIMLGANIGTTITAELMTIQVGELAVPIVILGVLFILIPRKICFSIGTTLLGLGCIFVAMRGFTSLADSIYSYDFVKSILLYSDQNNVIAILVGTVLTAIIQSSSAVIGVAMGFLHHQHITIDASIAIMLGANIGTCVTALLASIGAKKEAKWTAYAHVWLNVFGVLLFLPFIDLLSQFVATLSPSLEKQLAHASVIFNIACSLIALPLVNALASFIMKTYNK